ncbi:MAG: YfhO family protein [Anaerolineae bacterium]|nr:YfhO family protein [Anaerolineae bacterium]
MQRSKGAKNLKWAVPGLLLVGLILLFFNKMAFSNLILARGDTFLYFYPYWHAAAEALKVGRVPFWNDSLFMGVPLLANSQVGFFYPLNWPVWALLPTPYAVSASILVHVVIAGTGTYLLAKRALALEWQAALLTAVLFALGGYFTAQVEHINQVQGLAWLPWLLWAVTPRPRDWTNLQDWSNLRIWLLARGTAVTLFFVLQLFAGHTQTTFISGVAAGVWILSFWIYDLRLTIDDLPLVSHRLRTTHYALRISALFLGVILALLITAVQLLPTLELSSYSARQGGLLPNEVLSFSLNPLLLGRALLPSVGQSLFSEYVAFLPIVALVLAVVGAWQWRRWPGVLPALVLVILGLFLAFGVFNPVYWLLARLPGFNLFRVPARWLVLYGLGTALLAGVGFQILWDRWHLQTRDWKTLPDRAKENLWHVERPLRLGIVLVILLMAWNAIAGILAQFLPVAAEAPYEAANPFTLLLWVVEIVLVYLFVSGLRPRWNRDSRLKFGFTPANWGSPWWLAGLALAVLFLASRSLPYNNLTSPEAWFDLRPPTIRLLTDDTVPPGRLLSLSNIFFDPGDQGEIASIYADQLNEAALYDYIVAIKQKEIIAPNLPLAYGLASVDGFDGGILPLAAYSQLMRLILPDGQTTTDGRLREHLSAVPEAKWLDLFNGRYLITDKTGDQWRTLAAPEMDLFFDLQHNLTITDSFEIAYLPDFPVTALVVMSEGEVGQVLVNGIAAPLHHEDGDLSVWTVPEPPQSLVLTAGDAPWQVRGATLLNESAGTFMALTLGNYRLIHSGDVKLYENLDVLPRAFFVPNWQRVPNTETALSLMAEPEFDPRETAVLVNSQQSTINNQQSTTVGEAVITRYEPEQVVVQTNSAAAGLLLLTDANYPGWQATIDGQPVPIETADILFKSLFVPAGEHEVVFTFQSASFANGRSVSLIGLLIMLALSGVVWWKRPSIR